MSRPYLTAQLVGTGGLLKAVPEDFVVEEIPAYAATGEGGHLFLTVEKRGITTHEMVKRIAGALGIASTAIGTAGQKDRHAIARQVISVPADDPVRASNLKLDGVTVLAAARHPHKLRTGHLRGNRFIVVIRGVGPEGLGRARAIFDALATAWLPNFYGQQRFGRGDNADEGRALLLGTRSVHDRFKRRFLLSAYQSHLFNRYLAQRMAEGLLHRAIEGDVMQKLATITASGARTAGGLFVVTPTDLVASQARIEARQIVPTGPMFGSHMFAPGPGSTSAAREQAVLDEEGLGPDAWKGLGKLAEGTRRTLWVPIESPTLAQEEDRLTVAFSLPSGSYATVLLEELMKPGAPLALPASVE